MHAFVLRKVTVLFQSVSMFVVEELLKRAGARQSATFNVFSAIVGPRDPGDLRSPRGVAR